MTQIALPLARGDLGQAQRIIVGAANAHVVEALAHPASWPFGTAILSGPPRGGKSLLARWFAQTGSGQAIDDANTLDETELFHRWNRAQAEQVPLLLVCAAATWNARLPDLASRLAAALALAIAAPDDAMLTELIEAHAHTRGLTLSADALSYLAARCERSYHGAEALVAAIDRLSLERKSPPAMPILRAALDEVIGPDEPRLF